MAGKRLALLIANAEYQHTELGKLNAPQHDVRVLETLLTRPDIGGYQTQLLIDGTKGTMERAIDRMFTKGEREDTVLIFFAGHGLKHENGTLYFAAIDTEPEYLGGTAVSAGWLMEQMQNSHVGRQIVLLDCCFGGAFARGSVWRGGDRVESGRALEVPDLELEGRGQVIITSADAMQFALEGGALNGKPPASHFVRALMEGLETGEADRNPQDGLITIDELVGYLIRKLKIMGSPQRPSKWIFGATGGALVFAYNPRANAVVGSDYLSTLPVEWIEQVERYIKTKDYARALPLLQKAAHAGHTYAMTNLGLLYDNGWGVAQDYRKAREWYQKGADAGNPNAMLGLGMLYDYGRGVAKDYGKAREWYQKGAGNTNAMLGLGVLYHCGWGVAQDYGKAHEWYQKGADAGNTNAMINLGALYSNGWGVVQDYGKAYEWYQKGADAGNTNAMNTLGELYQYGQGVAQDYGKAREWYQKAADAGNKTAMFNLGVLYEKGGRGAA
jgi:TPR repeat protein